MPFLVFHISYLDFYYAIYYNYIIGIFEFITGITTIFGIFARRFL